MALKTDLKTFLPEHMRGSDVLNQFLDAAGELFDNFQLEIDGMKEFSDPINLNEDDLEQLAKQLDVDFPRNLGIERRRQYISEVVDIYRSNGTLRSLLRSFKLIGWDVDVYEAFIVDPSYYDTNSVYSLVNPEGESVDLYKYDIIVGTEVEYGREKFVDLIDAGGTVYPRTPIYGESYYGAVPSPSFVKVPYIKITINSEDYDIFTSDYQDPDTGTIYSYTTSETYQILDEIKNHFIEIARPAHVAILEISASFGFTGADADTLWISLLDSTFSVTTQSTGALYDGTLAYGVPMDRYILGETMGDFEYGTTNLLYYGVDEDAPDVNFVRTYGIGESGIQDYVPTRKHTTIEVTVPADVTGGVLVYVYDDDRVNIAQGTATPILLTTVSAGATAQVIEIEGYFAVQLNILAASSIGDVIMDVTHH